MPRFSARERLSDEHISAIGFVVATWPYVEGAVDWAIVGLMKTHPGFGILITSPMTFHQKRDLLRVLVKAIRLRSTTKKAFETKIVKRIERLEEIRNIAAHSLWTYGKQHNSLKPVRVKARGTIRFVGLTSNQNEPEYTPAKLRREARNMEHLAEAIVTFFEKRRLILPIPPSIEIPTPLALEPKYHPPPSHPSSRARPPTRGRRARPPRSSRK